MRLFDVRHLANLLHNIAVLVGAGECRAFVLNLTQELASRDVDDPLSLAMSCWALATMDLLSEPIVERFFEMNAAPSLFGASERGVTQWRQVVYGWRRAHLGHRRLPPLLRAAVETYSEWGLWMG